MDKPTASYESFQNRFFTLYHEGAYQQALELIESEAARFPVHQAKILGWQVAGLALLGRADEAVGVLRSAEERGCWYAAETLRGDPDFKILQEHPDFSELVNRLDARRAAAVLKLRPESQVTAPPGAGPHPLLVVLHGNNSSMQTTLPLWQAAAEESWLLAAVQSSQPAWTSGIYVWNDTARALDEMKAHMSELRAAYPVESRRIVAGGFSMGAHVALRMALDPDFGLRGVIAHEAWFDEAGMAQLAEHIRTVPPTDTRVVLIAGKDNSDYVQMARQVEDLLTGHGMKCDVVLSANAQHGYPPDFDQLLREALQQFS